MRKAVPLSSLVVLEAPAVMLLADRPDEADHYLAFRAMADAYFSDFVAGDREAIARMIDFYGGDGTFASWPERVRAYACETTAANIRDWQSAFGFPLASASLAACDVPSLVAWGSSSHPAVRRANALLAASLGANRRSCSICGAAHFMIATHPNDVAALISEHVSTALDRQRL
jgi:pimeloyl-ACP methyl ester carboxylesterase